VRVWGQYNAIYLTEWAVLGGPVIGFQYVSGKLSLIVGDKCRPKFFGVQKLNVQLGEKREV